MSTDPSPKNPQVAELSVRVAELERELSEQSRRTAVIVAEAQEKLYWLERWQVDLDAVMRKPGAIPALEALKRARGFVRAARRLKRRLLGS
ncbi:MAG: hypothetical protein H0V81_10565 [Solirubrobacterales bacterium]|nr:hypothetical protein [Solirubrobacterales bacterium]